jgi:quinolinate synthase
LKAKKSLDAMLAMASTTVGQGDLGPSPAALVPVTGD